MVEGLAEEEGFGWIWVGRVDGESGVRRGWRWSASRSCFGLLKMLRLRFECILLGLRVGVSNSTSGLDSASERLYFTGIWSHLE